MGTWFIPSLLDFNATGKYCDKMVFTAVSGTVFNATIMSSDPDYPVSSSNMQDITLNNMTSIGTFSAPGILLIDDLNFGGSASIHWGIE